MNIFLKRNLYILLVILSIDLITKLIAYYTLPFHEDIYLIGNNISLYLTYNTGSSGVWANKISSNLNLNLNVELFFSAINGIIFAIYIQLVNLIKKREMKKWLLLIPLFFINYFIIQFLKDQNYALNFSNYFISIFSKCCGITFFISTALIVKNKVVQTILICIISSGFGNLINYFYPPYYVVDFIYIKGVFELFKIGVFNFADIIYDLSIISLILYLIIKFIKQRVYLNSLKNYNLFKITNHK